MSDGPTSSCSHSCTHCNDARGQRAWAVLAIRVKYADHVTDLLWLVRLNEPIEPAEELLRPLHTVQSKHSEPPQHLYGAGQRQHCQLSWSLKSYTFSRQKHIGTAPPIHYYYYYYDCCLTLVYLYFSLVSHFVCFEMLDVIGKNCYSSESIDFSS